MQHKPMQTHKNEPINVQFLPLDSMQHAAAMLGVPLAPFRLELFSMPAEPPAESPLQSAIENDMILRHESNRSSRTVTRAEHGQTPTPHSSAQPPWRQQLKSRQLPVGRSNYGLTN